MIYFLPNMGELPSYLGGSHVIEHQSPPTTGTSGASGGSGISVSMKDHFRNRITVTHLLLIFSCLYSLTNNLDFDTGCGFSCLILQHYLIVSCVFALCDFDCQTCLVAVGFSVDSVAGIKNHLENKTEIQQLVDI